jgi:hypothetical protein
MRRFEPSFFYDDVDRPFSPESNEAEKWRQSWVAEKVLLLIAAIFFVSGFMRILPPLLLGVISLWIYRGEIEQIARKAYPDYEPGDSLRYLLKIILVAVLWLAWFGNTTPPE